MRDFSRHVNSVLTTVGEHLEVLPALGQATLELQAADPEEREDAMVNRDFLEADSFAETPTPNFKYRELTPLLRSEKHFFRYFLDGSYRTYFLATGMENERTTPIFLAQLIAGIVERKDNGKLCSAKIDQRWVFLISKQNLSEEAWKSIEQAIDSLPGNNFQIRDIAETDSINGSVNRNTDLRMRGPAKARYIMSEIELDLARSTLRDDPEAWLIKDGIINYGPGRIATVPRTIGVAKSFSKNLKIGTRGRKMGPGLNVTRLLADMPALNRTPAFLGFRGDTAFWYVRIRQMEQMRFPLFGVVKVEIPFRVENQPITSELVDEISRALIGERFVTAYGADQRWHSHLYSVYEAESFVKSMFYSTQVIQNCIRWS